MQWFKRNAQATKARRYLDRRSYVTMPRLVGDHDSAHEKLFGRDMSRMREDVLELHGYKCAQCGAVTDFETWLEVHHEVSRGQGGCDCILNLRPLCANFKGTGCHQRRHLERKNVC